MSVYAITDKAHKESPMLTAALSTILSVYEDAGELNQTDLSRDANLEIESFIECAFEQGYIALPTDADAQ